MTKAPRSFLRASLPAAPLALLAVPAVHGQVVYTNPPDVIRGSVFIDLGIPATGLGSVSGSTFAAADFQIIGNKIYRIGTSTPWFAYTAAGAKNVLRLTYGATIGPALHFADGQDYNLPAGDSSAYAFTTNFPPNATQGYIGTKMTVGGNDYYGWVRIAQNSTGNYTVFDFAYNSVPGQSIVAGVPEPATTAALAGLGALLAGSAAAWKRRTQKKISPAV